MNDLVRCDTSNCTRRARAQHAAERHARDMRHVACAKRPMSVRPIGIDPQPTKQCKPHRPPRPPPQSPHSRCCGCVGTRARVRAGPVPAGACGCCEYTAPGRAPTPAARRRSGSASLSWSIFRLSSLGRASSPCSALGRASHCCWLSMPGCDPCTRRKPASAHAAMPQI